jgi:chromosome segregation ATPase
VTADERVLRIARELDERDAALAASIAEVADLEREVEWLRERATEVHALLDRLPAEREAAAADVAAAREELGERSRALQDAEAALAAAEGGRDEEAVAAARRRLVRARDAVRSAERKLARVEEAAAELERAADAAGREAPELEARARELAARMRGTARVARAGAEDPEPTLPGVVDWAARARATVFVARGGLETERERGVREANELGASVLGEPLTATSVALVRRRLEAS